MALKSKFETLVTVFGGSGFLGRHVVRALANRNYLIRVAVRRPELTGYLQPLGRVGQIHAVQANVRFPQSIEAAVRDADVVINLVGILFERGRQRFDAVQAEGAGAVAQAANAAGARLIHVSAIGADENSVSDYARIQGGLASGWYWRRNLKPSSRAHQSCSVPRTTSSTASPRWLASPRRCRSPAAATPDFSRCLPATWRKRSPGPSMAK